MSSLDQDDEIEEPTEEESQEQESPTGFKAWTVKASNYVVSKMTLLEHFGDQFLQPPLPPERTEFSLEGNDEEGTTSGGTSGDDIWGTPTSGGPDDESFTASPVRDPSYQIRQFSKVRAELLAQSSFLFFSLYFRFFLHNSLLFYSLKLAFVLILQEASSQLIFTLKIYFYTIKIH